MRRLFIAIIGLALVASCTTVESGHKGVKVSWGGETDMSRVYNEGMDSGISWLWNDMVEYDVREKTTTQKFTFNDKNNMETGVEIALDYNLNPADVNKLHVGINDVDTKILKTLKSAGKEVVPQYSASELNLTKRQEAEQKLSNILSEELPEFFVEFARVQLTDVDIPKSVARLAEETAVQLGRNELAKKKEAEKVALAKALIAESKGKYEAAQYDAKTKDIMSQPKMLKLKELEIQEMWATKGVSPYGNNNVFGAGVSVLRGLNK